MLPQNGKSTLAGPQLTSFTGTKVQILTQLEEAAAQPCEAGLTSFTGTKVQILTQLEEAAAQPSEARIPLERQGCDDSCRCAAAAKLNMCLSLS